LLPALVALIVVLSLVAASSPATPCLNCGPIYRRRWGSWPTGSSFSTTTVISSPWAGRLSCSTSGHSRGGTVLLGLAVRGARRRAVVPTAHQGTVLGSEHRVGVLGRAHGRPICSRHDPSAVYYDTFTHSAGLMIGAALAAAATRGDWHPTTTAPRPSGHRCHRPGRVGGVDGDAGADASFTYRGGIFLASALTGLVITVAVRPGPVGRLLSAKPLRYLGARSYSLYLWHWPIICLTRLT